MQKYLPLHDWVLWMDCDSRFMNAALRIEQFLVSALVAHPNPASVDAILSMDGTMLNTGTWYWWMIVHVSILFYVLQGAIRAWNGSLSHFGVDYGSIDMVVGVVINTGAPFPFYALWGAIRMCAGLTKTLLC